MDLGPHGGYFYRDSCVKGENRKILALNLMTLDGYLLAFNMFRKSRRRAKRRQSSSLVLTMPFNTVSSKILISNRKDQFSM